MSTFVKKQPLASSVKNVCASGSSPPSSSPPPAGLPPPPSPKSWTCKTVDSTRSLLLEEVTDFVCDIPVWTTIPFLVAIIVSCSVSRIPFAWYVVCPAVDGPCRAPATPALWFDALEVSLNSISPVGNLGTAPWPLNL